ncbi:sensor histidine kinase [Hymenobacter busanensis]|uniref:sensor histidine kinase n=1 Tax=Hymenobacter busanensis TaxID=2607656 RepID=UPI0013671392|nr:histidine kinase [Hymenobacter busanensis]QHJ08812.1 histidine kinase [Hymenobacter busanensis]
MPRRFHISLPLRSTRLAATAEAPTAVPWWVHVLWLSVLASTDVLQTVSSMNGKMPPAWPQHLTRLVVNDALASLLFYFNWVVLIPRTLTQSRLGAFALGVLGLLALFIPLRIGSAVLLQPLTQFNEPHSRWMAYTVAGVVTGLMTIFFSSGVKITGDYLLVQRNRRELERQQLLTELSLLKMQVNPHFLFNTLNNIYSLASQKSDRAPEAVLRLAEIMRYMLYESSADTVPLEKELAHLRSFLDLQRLRLPAGATDAIVFESQGLPAAADFPIAPMLLLPLVENAFKHGDLSARPVVVISLHIKANHELRFAVRNPVAPEGTHPLDQPGGVGLTNLHRRLELLYPGRYSLTVSKPGGQHEVVLTLRNE